MKSIIITIQDNYIQFIENVPPGVVIETRNFDVDPVEDKVFCTDLDGDKYLKRTFTSEGEINA